MYYTDRLDTINPRDRDFHLLDCAHAGRTYIKGAELLQLLDTPDLVFNPTLACWKVRS